MEKTIAKIEKDWKEVYPEEEFNYTFFDESIAKFYKKEQDTASFLTGCGACNFYQLPWTSWISYLYNHTANKRNRSTKSTWEHLYRRSFHCFQKTLSLVITSPF